MSISNTPVIERIARVLAGQRLSANAKGDAASASTEVDACWRDYEDDALAVLRTLREADDAIASAGDPEAWETMILAALRQDSSSTARPTASPSAPAPSYSAPPAGTDPLHEGP